MYCDVQVFVIGWSWQSEMYHGVCKVFHTHLDEYDKKVQFSGSEGLPKLLENIFGLPSRGVGVGTGVGVGRRLISLVHGGII